MSRSQMVASIGTVGEILEDFVSRARKVDRGRSGISLHHKLLDNNLPPPSLATAEVCTNHPLKRWREAAP